jgi:hypothetical protein
MVMKKIFLLTTILLLPILMFSQQLYIGGASMHISGNAQVSLHNMDLNIGDIGGSQGKLYSGGLLTLNRNINNTSAADPFYKHGTNNGVILFTGTGNVVINSGLAITMQSLQIDKSSGGLTLNTPVILEGNLILNSGIINTSITNILTLGLTSNATGGSATSHVKGYMRKGGDATYHSFLFPLGTGVYYRPIGYTNLSAASTITARHLENNPSAGWDTNPLVEGNVVDGKLIHRISEIEYWEMTRTGGAGAKVRLSWDTYYSQVANHESLLAAVWNGSAWRNLGVNTFNVPQKTFDSFNSTTMFGAFTLASSQLPPVPGDVNSDGFVNVLDVVWMVSYINGSPPLGFNTENGDVNNDGLINIADLTALINLIMGGAKSPIDVISEPGHLYLYDDGNVSFISDGTLTALYFELKGEESNKADIGLVIDSDHIISYNQETGIGLIYSMTNTPFELGEIALMKIEGAEAVKLSWGRAEASNVSHRLVHVNTYKNNEATPVAEITESINDFMIFPNPGVGIFSVRFNLETPSLLSYEISDESGRIVHKTVSNEYSSGNHTEAFNISSIVKSGVYFLRLLEHNSLTGRNNVIREEKLIVVK